jgi:methionyl-tRNA synthetase
MIKRYFDGIIPAPGEYTPADLQIQSLAAKAIETADAAIDEIAIHEAIASVWTLVDELNNYITVTEPWVLAKDDSQRERLASVLYTTAEGLRVLAIALAPVMPKATSKLWAALTEGSLGDLADQPLSESANWGQLGAGVRVGDLESLFPRIETDDEGK